MRTKLSGMFFFLTICGLTTACNALSSPATTLPPAPATAVLTPTATETPSATATQAATPKPVPADQCPPFALDSFVDDMKTTIDPAQFRGKHYNPAEYKKVFDGYAGEMLDDVHALEELSQKTLRIEFLDRLICHNAAGKAFFEIKDAMILNLGETQSVARTCWVNGTADGLVLAIGVVDFTQTRQTIHDQDGWVYQSVDDAYRMDLSAERFQSIPTRGMECLQPYIGE